VIDRDLEHVGRSSRACCTAARGRELGQGVVEFGLILAIAAIVAVVAVVFFGPQLAAILDLIGAQVERPA
jgi:Flp pilus assembly pilin Flp